MTYTFLLFDVWDHTLLMDTWRKWPQRNSPRSGIQDKPFKDTQTHEPRPLERFGAERRLGKKDLINSRFANVCLFRDDGASVTRTTLVNRTDL